MPRLRSTQTEAAVKTLPSSDNELSDPPEVLSSPPASFKRRIARYEYTNTSAKENDTPPILSPSRPAKRLRTSTTTTIIKPSATASRNPTKKRRKTSKYAAPSKYAHLAPLTDILEDNLITIFVGTNPGVRTAQAGHAYAHPSNHFWRLLHSSGLTDRRLSPTEDRSLPARYCMGNTNIVSRPSKDAAELSKEEMVAGAGVLEEKFRRYRPESVCIVGKGIWEAIWRWKFGRAIQKTEFKYGWQGEECNMGMASGEGGGWKGARVFVATSTSGLAASLKPAEKEAIWRPFGEWVQQRRRERGFVPGDVKDDVTEEAAEDVDEGFIGREGDNVQIVSEEQAS